MIEWEWTNNITRKDKVSKSAIGTGCKKKSTHKETSAEDLSNEPIIYDDPRSRHHHHKNMSSRWAYKAKHCYIINTTIVL